MKKYLAVFRSRTDVLSFIDTLRKLGVYAIAVQTPSEAKIGCGISAEFSIIGKSIAIGLINSGNFSSFYGFFEVERKGKSITVKRL